MELRYSEGSRVAQILRTVLAQGVPSLGGLSSLPTAEEGMKWEPEFSREKSQRVAKPLPGLSRSGTYRVAQRRGNVGR